jgi:hypothetical protein
MGRRRRDHRQRQFLQGRGPRLLRQRGRHVSVRIEDQRIVLADLPAELLPEPLPLPGQRFQHPLSAWCMGLSDTSNPVAVRIRCTNRGS